MLKKLLLFLSLGEYLTLVSMEYYPLRINSGARVPGTITETLWLPVLMYSRWTHDAYS
jgi:hypothetical protein